MKKLLICLIVLSCRPVTKADILERRTQLKHRLNSLDSIINIHSIKAQQLLFKESAVITNDSFNKKYYKELDTISAYQKQKAPLQVEYDSLSTELEKY